MTSEPAIRVCLAMSLYPPEFGGHGIQIQNGLPAFAACNLAMTILTRVPPDGSEPASDAVPVHRVLTRGETKTAHLRRILEFRRHFREHGNAYDVLHATLSGWDLIANLAYVQHLGLPVIAEMVLLGGDDGLSIARSRFGAAKLRILRRHVDAWVGISRAFLPTLRAVGVPEDRFHVIYTGVDLARHRPRDESERRRLRAELDIPVDGRVAISVGSVMPRKGMDRVLRAWERLGPEPGRDLLVVAGPDTLENGLVPEAVEHAAELRRLADSGKLANTVRFTGRTTRVADYMGAADAFVFLSRREGLGTVILEALASGLPCLVSPLDGIGKELLVEGETGFVLDDPDDARAVAQRLATILDDRERRARMGELGRRAAVERFSMESRARSLAALYRDVVASKRAGDLAR